jgi:hypothetical protein
MNHRPRIEFDGAPLDGTADYPLPIVDGRWPSAFGTERVGSGYYVLITEVRHEGDGSTCGVGYTWVVNGSLEDLTLRHSGLFDDAVERVYQWQSEDQAFVQVDEGRGS